METDSESISNRDGKRTSFPDEPHSELKEFNTLFEEAWSGPWPYEFMLSYQVVLRQRSQCLGTTDLYSGFTHSNLRVASH